MVVERVNGKRVVTKRITIGNFLIIDKTLGKFHALNPKLFTNE